MSGPEPDEEPGVLTAQALKDLIENSSDLVTVVDADGRCTYASPAVTRLSGFGPDEVIGVAAADWMHPEDRDRVLAEVNEHVLGRGDQMPVVYRQLCRTGGFRHVEAHVSRLPDGHPLGAMVFNTRDITERVKAQTAHLESQNVIRMVAEGRPLDEVLDAIAEFVERRAPGALVAVMRLDAEGLMLRLAAGPSLPRAFAAKIDGLRLDENSGSCAAATRTRSSVIVADIGTDARWTDARHLAARWNLRSCWSTPVISTGANRVLGTLALYWKDLTLPTTEHVTIMAEAAGLATIALERYRIEGELAFQATHDDLTGLPNKALLQDRIDQTLARRRRRRGEPGEIAALFLDLDHFRQVNDTMGHACGDALLAAVAARLVSAVREIDTVARFGGDAFLVLAHTEAVEVLAGRINELMTASFPVGKGVRISCSIGVAIAGDDETPASLLRRADLALDQAKANGRNCYVVHDPSRASNRSRSRTGTRSVFDR